MLLSLTVAQMVLNKVSNAETVSDKGPWCILQILARGKHISSKHGTEIGYDRNVYAFFEAAPGSPLSPSETTADHEYANDRNMQTNYRDAYRICTAGMLCYSYRV